MTTTQIMLWARNHHYPQLLIGTRVLHHGERAWTRFLLSANETQLQTCAARIALWEYWVQGERQVQEVKR